MKTPILPPTVNLHNLTPCNYRCGFCYAGFASAQRSHVPQAELHEIIRQIAAAPLPPGTPARKVTFAGGEPLISSTVLEDVARARSAGLVTSLVTNGSLLTESLLQEFSTSLDWLTISIDSLHAETNHRIGRTARGKVLSAEDYLGKIRAAQALGIRVKLNTVVNKANVNEDFASFLRAARPLRWKLFQATRIDEENGGDFARWDISNSEFWAFVERHSDVQKDGIIAVPETQADIYGTYAMIGPNGCFFDNSQGTYRYSSPIIKVGIEAAFAEIEFSSERFRARQGNYDFATGLNRSDVAQ